MTISIASVSEVEGDTLGFDNGSPTFGSWRNEFWPTSETLPWGIQRGKFTFDWEQIVLKFSNMTPAIPKNAKIISAKLRGTPTATSTAVAFFTVIVVLAKDGLWDPVSSGPQWNTASATGTLPNMDVHVFNIGAATLVDTAISTTHNWSIRDNTPGRYLKAGQGVDIVTGGTLGFVDITIDREGTPASGNIFCEIYSQDANGLADVLLATSDVRLASTAPPQGSSAPFRFTFSGGAQIILGAGQKIVVVLNGDFPLDANNNVRVRWTRGGYAPGTFQLFGTGKAYDDQNYPMHDGYRAIVGDFGFGVWTPPLFTLGVDVETPTPFAIGVSLADQIAGYFSSPTYVAGDPIGVKVARSLAFFPPTGIVFRQWASFLHPTFEPVRLIVEWRERTVWAKGTL